MRRCLALHSLPIATQSFVSKSGGGSRKSHSMTQKSSISSIGTAALVLAAFCWLGFASYRVAPVWEGLSDHLPFMNRLMMLYGPIAAPIVGLIAAISIIVAGVHRPGHWVNPVLFVILCIVWVCGFRSLLFSGIFMGPAHQPASSETQDIRP